MKIVQQINIFGGPGVSSNSVRIVAPSWWKYFASRYSGVQAIYFECNARMSNGDAIGDVELYHMQPEDVIYTASVQGTAIARYVSPDLKEYFADGKDMVVRYRLNTVSDPGTLKVFSCSITIVQDDATESIKTATSYYLPREIATTTGNTYTGFLDRSDKVYINGYDGTIKHYFECYLYSQSGGTSYARLYDVTADAPVAGSEISTSETDPVYCVSGELTLIDGHYYCVQYRNGTSGKTAYGCAGQIVTTVAGFTKCVSIPCEFGGYIEENVNNWHTIAIRNFLGSLIEAGSESYKWDFYVNIEFGAEDDGDNVRLLRADNGQAVTGSAFNIPWQEAALHYHSSVDITPPASDTVLSQQEDSYYSYGMNLGRIVAFLEPTPPTYPYIPADPTMPSGYHAFMSNFVKNVTANYRPLATPDGVHRLY